MCVIITTPARSARPSLRHLELCERTNPHGSGLAWLAGRRVEYVKNLGVEEIHKHLRKHDGPAIVHFRIASVGGITPRLCHPFPVTHRAELRSHARARAVLFHNGTWSEHRTAAERYGLTFPKGEPCSDTRVAAACIARFGFAWLAKVRADYCRWAMLDADGIHRLGRWVRVAGCSYSNSFWMPTKSPTLYDWAEGFLHDPEDEDGEAPETCA